MISWNVRGLNERVKRLAIRESFLRKIRYHMLSRNKNEQHRWCVKKKICGRRLDKFTTLQTIGTRGVLSQLGMRWDFRKWRKNKVGFVYQWNEGMYCLTTLLQLLECMGLTSVSMRNLFFQELNDMKPTDNTPWSVVGDFNTTLEISERNSATQDIRWPTEFQHLISDIGLQDIRMEWCHFTWSNIRKQPAMTKLDWFFISTEWRTTFPNSKQ